MFRISVSLILLLCTLAGRACNLTGNGDVPDDDMLDSICSQYNLDDVVITGTRTPKFLKDVPVQMRVITSNDISRTDATNIQDLLQQELPGVEFSYAMNQQTHLNFAGFGGQSILFLVDGERLAGETMDDVDFSRLTMDNVERIEIVRGAASALYGSNAAGGVVNIITKKCKDRLAANLNARIGKHGEQRYGGSISLGGAKWNNLLSLNYNRKDNYDVSSGDNPVTRVISTIYGEEVYNVREKFSWNVLSDLEFTARAGYFFREVKKTADLPERYRDYSAGLGLNWKLTDRDYLQASYSFDQYDKSDYQRIARLDIRDYSNVQNALRLFYNHALGDGSVITVGADFMHDYLFNANISDKVHKDNSFDVFAQFDWQLDDRWEAVAALRYDYFSDGDNSRVTPKLNIRYKPVRNLSLRAGYGMGFRAPSLKEKYYNFDMSGIWIVEGNKNLKPEVSHNFNLSAEYAKGYYNFTVATYYNIVRNKLATSAPYFKSPTDKLPYLPYANLDRYNVYGMEAGVQGRWPCGLSVRLTYAYTKEDLPKNNDGQTINNQYIPARRHSLNVRMDYERQFSDCYGFSAGISGRVFSGTENMEYKNYYDISEGMTTVSYPAYTIWKLSLVQRVGRLLKISMALDNLFNYRPKYYYLNAPLTDGINLQVGLSVDL